MIKHGDSPYIDTPPPQLIAETLGGGGGGGGERTPRIRGSAGAGHGHIASSAFADPADVAERVVVDLPAEKVVEPKSYRWTDLSQISNGNASSYSPSRPTPYPTARPPAPTVAEERRHLAPEPTIHWATALTPQDPEPKFPKGGRGRKGERLKVAFLFNVVFKVATENIWRVAGVIVGSS